MATLGGIDNRNNSNETEAAKGSASETSTTTKVSPPPFIIYSETNEEFTFDDDLGVNNFESGAAVETKRTKRRNRRNRNKNKKSLREELKSMESLTLPDGVTLVEEGSYIGFHCTYCNCVMSSLKTVEEHAGGNPHKQKLRSKTAKGDDDVAVSSAPNSGPSLVPKPDVSLPSAPNRETMASLSKSALNKFLLKTKEPIVGLDHIIEVQLPDVPPTYRCNLCIIDSDSEGIKEHIIGTRHRLSYLRLMDTQKVAEMLALNLKKPERNKRTIKHTEELETMYGPGTIQVTDTPLPPITIAVEKETKSSAKPQVEPQCVNQDNQSSIQGIAQKRPSEGEYPPWKRQPMGRGFQNRKRYNSRRQQGSYFDRRQSTPHEKGLNYPIQYQEGMPINTEQPGSNPLQRKDQPFDRECHFEAKVEQNVNKPSERNTQHIAEETNKERDINTSFGKRDEHINREPVREHWDNKPFEKIDQHVNREANRGRGESWRSYSDNPHVISTFNRPQSDQHTASPSKPEQQMVMENSPSSEGLKNTASSVMDQKGYESTNMQCPAPPPPPPPPPFISNYQETGDQNNWRGRGRRGRFNNRNRGSSFSRFSNPSRFESNRSSGFSGFRDFGRVTSFRSLLSDPLSNERDRLKMKYPGLRLGR